MAALPSGLRWIVVCAAGTLVIGAIAGLAQAPPASPVTDVKHLYDTSCANCHGADGRGNGPAADALNPAPRDFTRGIYKFRSTASGSVPADADLYRALAAGLAGTSMPAWKGVLSDAQIRALVGYVKQFSPRFTAERPVPVTVTPPVAASPASLEKGRAVYGSLACGACHGDSGTGGAPTAELQDDWGHGVRAANLTEPWSFRGGRAAADIYMQLKTGIGGTPMPSFSGTAKDEDLWNVANYVASLARKPGWEMSADVLKSHYASRAEQDAASPVERGRYLVATLACAHCHSPLDREGRPLPGLTLAGGVKMRLVVWGEVVSPNLTSDNETGIGRYGDDELERAITRGIKRDGSRMLPFPMAWPAFAHLTPSDLKAVVAFLRTVPPVRNAIPPPARPGIFTYLATKFQMLIRGKEFPTVIFSGNTGSAGNPTTGASVLQH